MQGNIQKKMAEGIDNSKCILVMVTQRYMEKVNSGDTKDNCCFEFQYSHDSFGSSRMIAIVVEDRMTRKSNWKGIFKGVLGPNLYISLVNHNDPVVFETKMQLLAGEINRIVGDIIDIADEPLSNEKG